jgi:hypothetical protein
MSEMDNPDFAAAPETALVECADEFTPDVTTMVVAAAENVDMYCTGRISMAACDRDGMVVGVETRLVMGLFARDTSSLIASIHMSTEQARQFALDIIETCDRGESVR